VARGDDEVGTPPADVDRNLPGRLNGVDQHQRAGVVSGFDDRFDREPRPVGPGERAHAEQRRVFGRCRHRLEAAVEPSVLVDGFFSRTLPARMVRGVLEDFVVQWSGTRRVPSTLLRAIAVCSLRLRRNAGLEHANLDAVLALEALPRQDPRGVLEVGSNDDIVLVPVQRARDSVDPVGRALGERDLALFGTEQAGDGRSRLVVALERCGIHPVRRGASYSWCSSADSAASTTRRGLGPPAPQLQ